MTENQKEELNVNIKEMEDRIELRYKIKNTAYEWITNSIALFKVVFKNCSHFSVKMFFKVPFMLYRECLKLNQSILK